jgi:tetratricopeptide (TPR) repeat protein
VPVVTAPESGESRSRRTFSEPGKTRREGHLGDRTIAFRALLAGGPGAIIGAALGFFLWKQGGSVWLVPLCAVVVAGGVAATALLLTGSAGRTASMLHMPSSGSTPRAREYSQAESLVARGLYPEAVTAFELAASGNPSDPTPYLRVARIYRDHLGRPDDAARWFRKALREASPPRGVAVLATKELVELYVHRMGEPRRALPELARMAEEWAGSPEGEWAAAELRDIKERL